MCARVSLDLEGDLAKDRAWGFRALAGLAAEKYGYLRRQPWSLARARSRAVLEQLRDEYDRMDPSERHRVSGELFSGDLREAVDMYAAGGACMPELDSFLKSIEFLPITEEVIEAPHAAMNRELLRQRASSRPWMSATNRLQCNLELFLIFDDAQRAIFAGVEQCEEAITGGTKSGPHPEEDQLAESLSRCVSVHFVCSQVHWCGCC